MTERSFYFIGLDPSGSDNRASGIAVLDSAKKVVLLQRWFTLEELEQLLTSFPPEQSLIGIDGPLQPPHELQRCCFRPGHTCTHQQTTPYRGRYGEYQLIRLGFPCFPTSKNSFLKEWVTRCFDLNDWLQARGYSPLEVFPYATRRILFPTLSGKKQQRSFRRALQEKLQEAGIRFPETSRIYTHDELDALLAAFTAFLHKQGNSRRLGNEKDGWIIIPREASF